MPDFSKISSPYKVKDPSRATVAKQTQPLGGDGRNEVNHGPQSDNPRHDYASKLESRQGGCGKYEPEKKVIITAGPARNVNNHAFNRQSGYHSHMGTSKRAHSFPGRRP